MKNKDLFDGYEAAIDRYTNHIVPKFGATRLDWGFGKWLWLEDRGGEMENWRAMKAAGILTNAGQKMLERAEKRGGAK